MTCICAAVRRCLPALAVLISLTLAVTLGACGGAGDKPENVAIGVVNITPTIDAMFGGFKAGMAELGYVEGENVTYLYEGATGNFEGLQPAVQRLLEADVDLIFAITNPAALTAKQAVEGTDTPVLFAAVTSPVESRLVESLSKPGVNLTGIDSGGFVAKQTEWLLAIAPDIERLFVPNNPEAPNSPAQLAELEASTAPRGIELIIVEVTTADALFSALDAVPEDVDAIFVLASGFLTAHLSKFVESAIEHKLPLTSVGEGAKAGALMSYGHNYVPVGKQASRLAAKILEGTAAADLPVETAEFFLSINLVTADSISLYISDDILDQADVIVR